MYSDPPFPAHSLEYPFGASSDPTLPSSDNDPNFSVPQLALHSLVNGSSKRDESGEDDLKTATPDGMDGTPGRNWMAYIADPALGAESYDRRRASSVPSSPCDSRKRARVNNARVGSSGGANASTSATAATPEPNLYHSDVSDKDVADASSPPTSPSPKRVYFDQELATTPSTPNAHALASAMNSSDWWDTAPSVGGSSSQPRLPSTSTTPTTITPAFVRHVSAPNLHFSYRSADFTSYTALEHELDNLIPQDFSTPPSVPLQTLDLDDAFPIPNYLSQGEIDPYADYELPDENIQDEAPALTHTYYVPENALGLSVEVDDSDTEDSSTVEHELGPPSSTSAPSSEFAPSPKRAPSPSLSILSETTNGSVQWAREHKNDGTEVLVDPALLASEKEEPSSPLTSARDDSSEYLTAPSPAFTDMEVQLPKRSPSSSTSSLSTVSNGGKAHQKRTFKVALWEVINNPVHNEFIHWHEDGLMGVIPDKPKFVGSPAMKAITDARDIGGFVRQLHMWGFNRFRAPDGSEHSLAFSHEHFRKGRTDLMEQMSRKGEAKLSRISTSRRKSKKPKTTRRKSTSSRARSSTAKEAKANVETSKAAANKTVKVKATRGRTTTRKSSNPTSPIDPAPAPTPAPKATRSKGSTSSRKSSRTKAPVNYYVAGSDAEDGEHEVPSTPETLSVLETPRTPVSFLRHRQQATPPPPEQRVILRRRKSREDKENSGSQDSKEETEPAEPKRGVRHTSTGSRQPLTPIKRGHSSPSVPTAGPSTSDFSSSLPDLRPTKRAKTATRGRGRARGGSKRSFS